MKRSFGATATAAAVFLAANSVEAFSPNARVRGSSFGVGSTSFGVGSSSSIIFLHPSQAADLEACAYDLMREYVDDVNTSAANLLNEAANSVEASHATAELPNPLAWCRRVLPQGPNGR